MDRSIGTLRLKKFFVAGLFGGILATILLFAGTELLGFPFPPLAIFQLLISPVPGSIQSVVVDTFHEYAKYTAFVFSSALFAVLYGLIAVGLAFLFKRNLYCKAGQATIVGTLVPTVISLGLQLQLAGAFSAISSLYGWIIAAILSLAVNLVYARTVISYTAKGLIAAEKQIPAAQSISARRGFLKRVGIAAAVLVLAAIASKIGLSILSNQPVITSGTSVPINPVPKTTETTSATGNVPSIFSDPRISDLVGSEVTDNRIFYRVDINPIPPQLNFDQWTMNIHGKVSNAMKLDKTSLMQLPKTDEFATLECVSNTIRPPGGLISNAKWTGVPLAKLLNQAGPLPDAKYIIFRCGDGYTVGVPIERAQLPGALLAYEMNDATLPTEHGFPLRAIVPGIYGMMNAKWITEIELTDQVYLGYWQERGWSNDARIKTTSIIYYPSPNAQVNGSTPIAGVAFAGDRGISKVEVSVDGGSTWNEATLKPPRSPYSWVLWAYAWNSTIPGTANIVVRAYDGKGQVQDSTATQSFPDGASGYSSVQVTVA
jgi:DMSO/TMAO reductase YedYZ molybdopterin-dependent catalytic subunit